MSTALVFREDAYARACDATVLEARANVLVLDRTVFYPLGGGQPGDTGRIGGLRVVDTRKGEGETVLHIVEADAPLPAPGTRVRAEIDWPRRYRLMRLHTALHLLGAVVGAPVTGGRIAEDKAHLDFDIEMERLAKDAIEERLNALVRADLPTRTRWISDAELDARPELVRTMSVAPPRGAARVRLLEIPGVDLQACGGTHVARTGEIGAVAVTRIRSEGRRNRRVTIALLD